MQELVKRAYKSHKSCVEQKGENGMAITTLPEEIRSLEIDFHKDILKINGQEIIDVMVVVKLPGPEGYKLEKAFNMKKEQNPGSREILEVCCYRGINGNTP